MERQAAPRADCSFKHDEKHKNEPRSRTSNRQKPSSARPTQLNANIDEAIAVNVTMVLMDRMT
jgi:hypothetical protein